MKYEMLIIIDGDNIDEHIDENIDENIDELDDDNLFRH